MSDSPENFEKLQMLLKFKRHEQPPPGYFNTFADNVIGRIEMLNRSRDRFEEAPWIGKIFRLFQSHPISGGIFGVSFCAMLIMGLSYLQGSTATSFTAVDNGRMDMASSDSRSLDLARAVRADSTAPSINPMFNTNVPGALFGSLNNLNVQQISFSPGN